MDLRKTIGKRSRLVRTVLAAVLTVVAASSLRKGKRLTGALAGVGALAVGYGAATESGELAGAVDIEMGGEEEKAERRCAACGEPIVPGQRRGPNESGEIVHEDCE